jgi:hypothetical protein
MPLPLLCAVPRGTNDGAHDKNEFHFHFLTIKGRTRVVNRFLSGYAEKNALGENWRAVSGAGRQL